MHCLEKLQKNYYFFCSFCIERLIIKDKSFDKNAYSVFEKTDVFFTFLKEIKKQKFFGLIKAAAAVMSYHYLQLNKKFPDVIKTKKQSFLKKDHNYLLAKEISKILKRPFVTKSKDNQNVLYVLDVLKKDRNLKRNENIYTLSLCLDIFFDHFHLSR